MSLLDDASTDIDAKVTIFIRELEKASAKLHFDTDIVHSQWKRSHEAAGTKAKKRNEPKVFPKSVTLKISPNKNARTRTPRQQANSVVKGGSWVCWGAHMSDKARHVILIVDGKPYYGLGKCVPIKPFRKVFEAVWSKAMKAAGVLNFKGEAGYRGGDEFHLELPDAKISKTSDRAKKCMEEYVRQTRKQGKSKNKKFEKSYKKLIEKTEKALKIPPNNV